MLLIPVKRRKFAIIITLKTVCLRKIFTICFFLVVCLTTLSQQNNNWYFGRLAALSFNPKPGKTIPYALDSSAMISNEASASVSDENGNLLFYTNGNTVYNRKHQEMLNGDNLDGNLSACQCAIVRIPGNDSIYYIFTTDAVENGFQAGYRYSVVNMKRDNGDGEVISKNNLLWGSCTERMTIIRHRNGIDIWLVTNDNNSNVFRSWLITCNGLQPNPVVSTIGIVMNQHNYTNSGIMKASPDGKYFCQTHFPFSDQSLSPSFAQLFDFDNSMGIISNARKIQNPGTIYAYCSFSPDSKLLYLTRTEQKKIDQLEITLPTISDILASTITIPTLQSCYDLQLAPDEKIYISKHASSIPGIAKPDVKGPGCAYSESLADATPYSTYLGMPSVINDISSANSANGFTYSITDSCSGVVQFNGYSTLPPGSVNWFWDFGDGNTSTLQNPVHTFTPSINLYTVKLKITSVLLCSSIDQTRFVQPAGNVFTKADFSFITKCDSGYVRFTNNSTPQDVAGWQFIWDFGDGNTSTDMNPIHSYDSAGNYTVKLKLKTNAYCLDDSLTQAINVNLLSLAVTPSQTIPYGGPIQLFVNGPNGTTYQWSPPLWLTDPKSATPIARPLRDIDYTVTATDTAGCKTKDSVSIRVLPLIIDDIYVPSAFTPNSDGMNDVIRPLLADRFTLKEFSIYNRWGQKVFSTSERDHGWDGKIKGVIQNTDTYVWILEVTDTNNVHYKKKGSLVLLR